ncbi:auxin-induced protein 6B-like [Olea europaea var. sylvestris]|uniref:Auxin-responsive SAUR15-like n=1 Tax=Olea europaea subsp. europaea TaxID=158383 RepID=A0A8S0QX18_OLEEU|nr:auxin-induced protein 6B-like [Olea europaea var. sylvestris]CAA2970485.1 auxin-responsive SAUR15-like [Olea europaea subsp. europaea]
MLGKKLGSMKKLAKKVKVLGNADRHLSQKYECLLRDDEGGASPTATTRRTGTFAVYVGEDRQKFVVPTAYLSHPLFKILLEKAYNEFGFQQSNGLVLPCSVTVFQEVISAVECSHRKFDFGEWVEEFI